jgi:hypothetical protein
MRGYISVYYKLSNIRKQTKTEGNFLNTMKAVFENLTASITLHGE